MYSINRTRILAVIACLVLCATAEIALAWQSAWSPGAVPDYPRNAWQWQPGPERPIPPAPDEGYEEALKSALERLGDDACAHAARVYAADPDRQDAPADTEVFPEFERYRNDPRLEPGPRGEFILARQLTNECRRNMPNYMGSCAEQARQTWAGCYVHTGDRSRCSMKLRYNRLACNDYREAPFSGRYGP